MPKAADAASTAATSSQNRAGPRRAMRVILLPERAYDRRHSAGTPGRRLEWRGVGTRRSHARSRRRGLRRERPQAPDVLAPGAHVRPRVRRRGYRTLRSPPNREPRAPGLLDRKRDRRGGGLSRSATPAPPRRRGAGPRAQRPCSRAVDRRLLPPAWNVRSRPGAFRARPGVAGGGEPARSLPDPLRVVQDAFHRLVQVADRPAAREQRPRGGGEGVDLVLGALVPDPDRDGGRAGGGAGVARPRPFAPDGAVVPPRRLRPREGKGARAHSLTASP